MGNVEMIGIEVAYALPEQQVLLEVQVEDGATVKDGIEKSGVLFYFPDIDLDASKVGIFGKLTKLDTTLHQGDRVEIYRPLLADPKEVRRLRAAQGKGLKKGGA